MKRRPGEWQNNALVILDAPSLAGFSGVEYREPDFGNEITGIATTDKKGTECLKLLPV